MDFVAAESGCSEQLAAVKEEMVKSKVAIVCTRCNKPFSAFIEFEAHAKPCEQVYKIKRQEAKKAKLKLKRDQKKAMKVATENENKKLVPQNLEIISHALQKKPKRAA